MRLKSLDDLLFFIRWQFYPIVLSLPAHISFVMRGWGSNNRSSVSRFGLAIKCIHIHLAVRCGHNPAEALKIVEEIISLPKDRPGIVVECGAFLGGSTAKISHAVASMQRKLIVCDSFRGLPDVAPSDHSNEKRDFQKGEYEGRLEEVKENVALYGQKECVDYIPGWYSESLVELQGVPIACAFWDVDLQESFKSCIKGLWANMQPGSKVFIHDFDRESVVAVFTDSDWWLSETGEAPPEIKGAFTGLGTLSPLLGYAVKTGVSRQRLFPAHEG
ncbi:MAG TPA: TylF/MycF/NovP-related O-methyltransferase [Pyrinomonadaceae bacterium]|nr:TylF/MycF/NovP-related O-methyltransferase [Pyrinomonadaceae bacterium]